MIRRPRGNTFTLIEVLIGAFILAGIGLSTLYFLRSARKQGEFGSDHFEAILLFQKILEDCTQEITLNPNGFVTLGFDPGPSPLPRRKSAKMDYPYRRPVRAMKAPQGLSNRSSPGGRFESVVLISPPSWWDFPGHLGKAGGNVREDPRVGGEAREGEDLLHDGGGTANKHLTEEIFLHLDRQADPGHDPGAVDRLASRKIDDDAFRSSVQAGRQKVREALPHFLLEFPSIVRTSPSPVSLT